MPRTRSLAWSELKIGVLGIIALALLAFIILAVGGEGGYWWQRYELKTRFADVQGLKEGAVVRLNGKEIGTVTGVEFAGQQVDVTLEVNKKVQPLITTTSLAEIASLTLLGEPILDLKGGTGGTPLKAGDYIPSSPTKGPIDEVATRATSSLEQIDKLLTDVRAGRGTLGKLVTDEALYTELTAFVTSAQAVTNSIRNGRGTLGQLTNDPAAYNALKTSLENLQTMTARINGGQGALGRFLNDEAMGCSMLTAVTNVEQVTGRIIRGEGTAGKLFTDQQLYDRLNSMANRIDGVVAGLEAGRGTAGQLLHDQELYENMNRTVTELRNLFSDIRKDPKKYLNVKVSIF